MRPHTKGGLSTPFSVINASIRSLGVTSKAGLKTPVSFGAVTTPDLVSQIADFLLAYERMRWSICTGRYDGRLFVSLRTNYRTARAGVLLGRLVRDRGGRAGGHGMIAGGSIELRQNTNEAEWARVEEQIVTDLLRYLGVRETPLFQYPFQVQT